MDAPPPPPRPGVPRAGGTKPWSSTHGVPALCPQVNREIVCGLRCLHLTYRRGRPGEWGRGGRGWWLGAGGGLCHPVPTHLSSLYPSRPVDRDVFMVGSYAPRAEEYEVVTPAEEAPRGWLARGSYRVRSFVTDDDKTEHLSWEWGLCIKKAWED